MARPSKPANVIRMEGCSHRTRAELEQREKGEKALLTGMKMREAADVKADPYAHAVWKRTYALLKAIGKNDALYEQVINRYCRLSAEEHNSQRELARIARMTEQLETEFADGSIKADDYFGKMIKLMEQAAGVKAMLMRQRRMLMEIEKENIMTIAAALRAVPKTPQQEDDKDDPMAQMLSRRAVR